MSSHLTELGYVRPIPPAIDPNQLKTDLTLLRNKALELGASDVAEVSGPDVIFCSAIQEEIARNADYPSVHWPLDYPKDDMEEAIQVYDKGLLFAVSAAETLPNYGGGPILNLQHRNLFLRVYEIVSKLESISFYMGYHLAMGFAAGNCRSVFCPDEKRCVPMLKGKACIRPNMGRPSMEAAGMDGRRMAEKAGWMTEPARSLLTGLLMVA